MSRKLILFAVVLGVLAAACAQAPVEPSFGSGERFAAAVVDPLNDAGRLSSTIVLDGRPIIAYVSFEEEVPEGSFPQPRPIGLPSLPGIMLATTQDGVWIRGAIAIEQQINNVDVAFNPAFEESVGSLAPESVTGLQLVADDGGMLHAVWGSKDGLFYAMGTADPASTTQWTVERVTETRPFGPSLTLDGSGNPWIAYTTGASAANLVVATLDGSVWTSEVAVTGAGCEGCRTGIAVDGDGAPVVAFGDGADLNVVTPGGKAWDVTYSIRGGSGIGLAATSAPDGSVAVSYQSATEVQVASGTASGDWSVVPVAEIGEGGSEGRTTGVAIDDQGLWTVAWYDPGSDAVAVATSPDGQAFSPAELGNTVGAQSPSVATTPDGTTSFVSWYESAPQNLVLGAFGEVGDLAVAVPSPTPTAVGEAPVAPPAEECTPVENGTVTVVAEGIAFTEGVCIEAVAGEAFTIVFDNRDADVQHNVQVFTGPEPSGDLAYQGELITGPSQIEYQIPALDEGEYAYNCLVHPAMVGKIVVGAGGGAAGATGATGATSGGDGAAVTTTVVAENIAFDTGTITLAADVESTITLDNRDAGVQHNIAIYTDSSMTEELFNGELITGPTTVDYSIPPLPAGEYYFVCIVHLNMNGAVVVQ